ncbi:hemolysin secretion protein D [Pantoea sp. RIT-PI-b]|uniref:efflux RND transporter periplasmic adaptor subunit n=1 Tax=Pantoea sp. RIT-PI-b TaxID=1681195 RepID=UPI000676444D|nr:efflux RND transporter periplasmic adaptor subunit [Pantoea sp. RIT-PI-b]KNC05716.1 hemolysin secretion protein D [Pantoea sp. RIT-PI-b]
MLRHLLFFSVACLVTGCGEPASSADDPRTQPPLIRTAAVQPAAENARVFTGTVAARVQSDLGFRVSGKVLERLVDKGQSVRRGQLLMKLDPADLALQVRAAEGVVNAAQARARQAGDDENRYRGLVGTGAVSASSYSQIRAAAEAARADLSAAQAQARVALNASQYAVLSADADGVVVDTLADPGQVVSAGQTVVRLARAGQREAMVSLPETLRPQVGSTATAVVYGSQIVYEARLRELSDAADAATRTYEARYVLSGAAASAPLGSTVTLRIPESAGAGESWSIPLGALWDAGSGPGVWVVTGKPAKVTWRAVTLLGISDDSARVSGPLHGGEQVAALGAHLLHEGEAVRSGAPEPEGVTP